MRIIDFLESDRTKYFNENQVLTNENRSLREEGENLRKKLATSEEAIIQLESEKQHLEFMNKLQADEKDALVGFWNTKTKFSGHLKRTIAWLIDWSNGCSIDRLIDWLIDFWHTWFFSFLNIFSKFLPASLCLYF